MNILTLDTATTVGWALGDAGTTPAWGSRSFDFARSNGEKIGRFRIWLHNGCEKRRPDLIVYEKPYIPNGKWGAPVNAHVLRVLLPLAAEVEAVAWLLGIEVREVEISDLTKFFLGSVGRGRAAKKAATIAMCAAYGWDTEGDDDAADALSIWAMTEAKVAPELSLQRGCGPLFIPPQTAAAVKKTTAPGRRNQGRSESGTNPGKSQCQQTRMTV